MSFRNRAQAGRRLADALRRFDGPDVVIVGLARGGVAVAAEVARELDRPLDVLIVRKIRVPFARELAMGAVGEDGVEIIDREILASTAVSDEELETASESARMEAAEVLSSIRADRPAIDLSDRVVFLIDDGIATGSTAKVACQMLRMRGARSIVLAVPVAPREAASTFRRAADEFVTLETPDPFFAVGSHYDGFPQLSDEDVVELLRAATRPPRTGTVALSPGAPAWTEDHVEIPIATDHGPEVLDGDLCVPPVPAGVVAFVHGSGSSRHSARNIRVAGALNDVGFATLLYDLTTREEWREQHPEPDLAECARRTVDVVKWLGERFGRDVPIGLVGSSTGAAVALMAAADQACDVTAVACRGGRVDLASGVPVTLDVPVLLVVGGADDLVVEWNLEFASRLRAPHDLAIVEGASHLFTEPGALEEATALLTAWFERWLVRAGVAVPSRNG